MWNLRTADRRSQSHSPSVPWVFSVRRNPGLSGVIPIPPAAQESGSKDGQDIGREI